MTVLFSGVSKLFDRHLAVDDVSFEVQKGEMCALIGANGAGKSTLLSIGAGLIKPTTGWVSVDGINTQTADGRSRIGVVPEVPELIEGVSGLDLLSHIGVIRGLPRDRALQKAKYLAEAAGVPQDNRPIGVYSTGNRKRLTSAMALMVSCSALFLDEPLEAVDPIAASRLTLLWKNHCKSGGVVLISSHDLRFVAEQCDRVIVFSKGSLVEDIKYPTSSDELLSILRRYESGENKWK